MKRSFRDNLWFIVDCLILLTNDRIRVVINRVRFDLSLTLDWFIGFHFVRADDICSTLNDLLIMLGKAVDEIGHVLYFIVLLADGFLLFSEFLSVNGIECANRGLKLRNNLASKMAKSGCQFFHWSLEDDLFIIRLFKKHDWDWCKGSGKFREGSCYILADFYWTV